MKKIITLILCLNFSILLCQENFWNDVLLEVPSPETSNVIKLIDGFYSKIDFPEGVGLSVSRIAYKGENMRATHILSFLSKSSQSLSDFLNSLTGPSWDSYIKEMRNIDIVRLICKRLDLLAKRDSDKKYEQLIEHVVDRPGHDKRYAIDSAKINQVCHWRPNETFETGINKTIQWYLDNQAWVDLIYRKEKKVTL